MYKSPSYGQTFFFNYDDIWLTLAQVQSSLCGTNDAFMVVLNGLYNLEALLSVHTHWTWHWLCMGLTKVHANSIILVIFLLSSHEYVAFIYASHATYHDDLSM